MFVRDRDLITVVDEEYIISETDEEFKAMMDHVFNDNPHVHYLGEIIPSEYDWE